MGSQPGEPTEMGCFPTPSPGPHLPISLFSFAASAFLGPVEGCSTHSRELCRQASETLCWCCGLLDLKDRQSEQHLSDTHIVKSKRKDFGRILVGSQTIKAFFPSLLCHLLFSLSFPFFFPSFLFVILLYMDANHSCIHAVIQVPKLPL